MDQAATVHEAPIPYLPPPQASIPVPINPGDLLQVVRGDHMGAFVVFYGSERDGEALRLKVYHQGLQPGKFDELTVDPQDVFPVGRPRIFWRAKFPDTARIGPVEAE
jgi:hypothetical protein